HAIDRQSYGSFAYPVAVYVCFLAYQYSGNNLLFFYLPVLTLAICDPLAALCGRRWPRGPYRIGQGHKSLMGSSMFFLSSTLLTLLFLARMSVIAGSLPMLGMAVTVSLTATLAEAFSGRGLDNVTIPLAVLFILSFFNMLF
ncbi:MAG TPA: phosphatidate cytidylyltransferase, partial [Bacteroidia bacterium]|nr:phosphatidate cytidylyltransferase [Bacteroidia bacterium]